MEVGERDGHGITVLEHVERLGRKAQAVLAVGSCAAFGGIPKANMNPSASKGVAEVLTAKGIDTPVINLPGCAVHPDWFIGTVAALLLGGPGAVKLDENGRPLMHYSKLIHDNCPLRGQFDAGRFAQKFGDEGCLYKLGCKGPVVRANCPEKKFNSGTNWCIENHHPCIGCAEPAFPYEGSMYDTVPLQGVTPPAAYPPIFTTQQQKVDFSPTYGALAGLAVGAAGVNVLKKRSAGQDGNRDGKE
jgi:hydrogenase small subunit